MQSLKQTCYFARKKATFVNKGQNILHKISLASKGINVYKYIFIWRANILPEYHTSDEYGSAHQIKMLCVQQDFFSKPLA